MERIGSLIAWTPFLIGGFSLNILIALNEHIRVLDELSVRLFLLSAEGVLEKALEVNSCCHLVV